MAVPAVASIVKYDGVLKTALTYDSSSSVSTCSGSVITFDYANNLL